MKQFQWPDVSDAEFVRHVADIKELCADLSDFWGVRLVNVCVCCPETYDVFQDDQQTGYIKYMQGKLTVWYPDYGEQCIYSRQLGKWEDSSISNEQRKELLSISLAMLLGCKRIG